MTGNGKSINGGPESSKRCVGPLPEILYQFPNGCKLLLLRKM